ncbi:cytochrome P450 94C1-like isoform X1 [Solanum dulcamara]|uniref:cytochrome P450 94C1-like isoform X1 n=1 Tax=Solanum dulcamara TaxID=45834 RepID=UPI0024868D5A|nr:cytochrome P450 94C1-like isoform X1 [Solanum dulcamara]
MDHLDDFWKSFHVYFILIFIIVFLFTLILYIVRLKLWCNCEICHAYITKSWSSQFINLCDWYTHLLKQSPNRTIHIHVLGNIITSNPQNVEYMLKTRFENYPKGKTFSTILGDFLGRGIFNVDGDLWRFQKRISSLELGKVSIRSYAFEVVKNEIVKRLLPLLDEYKQASKLSAERAMTTSPIVWKIKRFLNIGSEKELREAIKMINILAQEVIRQKRKLGFSNHKDLLSRFMGSISDETYLRDIVISFLLAGRDTITSALTSFFYVIVNHPEVAKAIREEADRVLGPNKDLTSCEQMSELHYLQASIYESMRLYPPIQFDSKFCLEDDFLPDGTFVKKGTRVTYHPYAMGRMEELWGCDALEFNPQRWLKDGVFVQENPFKYPVFQAGLRVCLGKQMALVELKSVSLSLLRRFHVELAQPYHHTPRFSPGLTASFNGGLLVSVQEISP